MISATLLVIALAAASVNGAVQIDDTLERRIVLGEGGWALSATSCPSGSSVITDNGFEGCCPTTYQHDGHACCPSGSSCASILEETPYCANTDWVLWNSTTVAAGQGFFCCLAGEVGTDALTCVANTTSASAAARLGRPLPSGVTIAAASSSTSSPSTTSSTAGFTITSASASATAHSSNAVTLLPSSILNIQGAILLFLSCILATMGSVWIYL